MDASPLNELSSVLEQLVERIHMGKVSIFCGAGISKNPPSSLPLARDLRKSIVESLMDINIFEEEIRMKLEEGLVGRELYYPFEAFIQIVNDNAPNAPFIDTLIEIYGMGKPNRNHVLFAELMKNSYVKEILTTNFDTKIEEALECERVNFKVLSRESEFSKICLGHIEVPTIFKIHGTIRDRDSVRVTLEAVSRRELQEARANIIRRFLEEIEHDILIVGYSVRDEFDINPIIRGLKSKNQIFLIEHSEKELEVFRLENMDPFKGFKGWVIRYNTDNIIDYIWRDLIGKPWKEEYVQANDEWKKLVKNWSLRLQKPQRFLIVASLLREFQEYKEAEKIYRLCLNIFRKNRDQSGMAASLYNLALIQRDMGDNKAEKTCEQSLHIFEKLGNLSGVAKSYHLLAMIHQDRGDYDRAEKLYKQSLEIKGKLEDRFGVASSLHQLAMIQQKRGNYNEAEKLYMQSLTILEKLGNLSGIAISLYQIGNVQQEMGNYDEAEKLYRQRLEIEEKLGNQRGIASSIAQLAVIQQLKGNYEEAEKLCSQSQEYFKNLKKSSEMAALLHLMANIKCLKGSYDEADKLYRQALNIFKKQGKRPEVAICIYSLGQSAERHGKLDTAAQYYEKSLKLFVNMKQKYYERIAREGLERVRSKLSGRNAGS